LTKAKRAAKIPVMDKFLAELITSEAAQDLSSDALRIYLILRADITLNLTHTARAYKKTGELVSGLDVQSIADRSKVPSETARRLLGDLVKRGWLRVKKLSKSDRAYQLGTCHDLEIVWFISANPVDETSEPTLAETIRERAKEASLRRQEARSKLSKETQQKVGKEVFSGFEIGIDAGRTHRRTLMDHFKERYRSKYGETPEIFSSGPWGNPSAQANSYVKRFYDWCGDFERAKSLIDFMFDNWPKIFEAIGGKHDKPSLNILGSKALFGRLQIFQSEGIPKPKERDTTARRHDKTASEADPDVGW
jgi:hypothetical protein